MAASAQTILRKRKRLGWWVVALSFFCDAAALGSRAFFAVTILLWETEFGLSRAYLSGIGAMVHVLQGVATPIAGHILDLAGPQVAIAGGLFFLSVAMALTAAIGTGDGMVVDSNGTDMWGGSGDFAAAGSGSYGSAAVWSNISSSSNSGRLTSGSGGSGSGVNGGTGGVDEPSLTGRWQLWVIYGGLVGLAFGGLNMSAIAYFLALHSSSSLFRSKQTKCSWFAAPLQPLCVHVYNKTR